MFWDTIANRKVMEFNRSYKDISVDKSKIKKEEDDYDDEEYGQEQEYNLEIEKVCFKLKDNDNIYLMVNKECYKQIRIYKMPFL